jgi:hypothetical protein
VIDDESLVKTRTNTCLSETSGIPSYSVIKVSHNHVTMTTTFNTFNGFVIKARVSACMYFLILEPTARSAIRGY